MSSLRVSEYVCRAPVISLRWIPQYDLIKAVLWFKRIKITLIEGGRYLGKSEKKDIQLKMIKFHSPACVYLLLLFSCPIVSDSVTPWTVARQTPLPIRFTRQESWSGLPFLPLESSQPRDRSCISCIGRQILYLWATWELPSRYKIAFYKIH